MCLKIQEWARWITTRGICPLKLVDNEQKYALVESKNVEYAEILIKNLSAMLQSSSEKRGTLTSGFMKYCKYGYWYIFTTL